MYEYQYDPTEDEIEEYSNGRCDVLAIAISELTDGEIRCGWCKAGDLCLDAAVDWNEPVLRHAWVVVGDVAIDVLGRRSEDEIMGEYEIMEAETISAGDLMARVGMYPGPLGEAREFIRKYRNYFLGFTRASK